MTGAVPHDPVDVLGAALDNPASAPGFADAGDPGPAIARGDYDNPVLLPDCPVKTLGFYADITGTQRCYYLDVNGQLVGLEAGNRHGKLALAALFGRETIWLEEHFPQWSAPVFEGRGKERRLIKESEIIGFDQKEAAEALVIACVERGIFDAAGRIRGRGAHRGRPGPEGSAGLILHCGNKVLAARQRATGTVSGWDWEACGLIDGFVYPTGGAIPRPWHEKVGSKAGDRLLQLLMTWNWKRPLLDPRFLLGWIGSAMIGGALTWRPNIWITGGRGTGKSTLNGENGVLDLLFGDGKMQTGNSSAAAIRQMLKNSTVPVMFDEIEASADNRRVNEVVELARVSSSGAKIHRGGQDHQAHEFTLRSCFQFSSINIPPLEPQDRSRLGILELKPFPIDAVQPVLADYRLPELGQNLLRRMIDGWPRYQATLDAFKAGLRAARHDQRACDQFGALLAAADLLLNDDIPDAEEVAHWVSLCNPLHMAEISEATADETACLMHILTSMQQARGGDERESLGTWIGKAVAATLTQTDQTERAGYRLQELGLKLVNPKLLECSRMSDGTERLRWGAESYMPEVPGYLAIANSHQALAAIFANTKWQGGVWRQSLARTDGALDPVKLKFGRLSLTGVLVPLACVLDESELPKASKPEAVAAWLDAQKKGAGA